MMQKLTYNAQLPQNEAGHICLCGVHWTGCSWNCANWFCHSVIQAYLLLPPYLLYPARISC